jgi:hypothetical protein
MRHDKRAVDPQYVVGDLVWLFSPKIPVGLSPKFYKKWRGPYYITEIGPNFTYKLRDGETNKVMRSLVHANRLKRFFDPKDRSYENEKTNTPSRTPNTRPMDQHVNDTEETPTSQSQQSVQDDNLNHQPDHTLPQDNWGEVERLLKASRGQGKKWYRVKWKDKSPSTWVPEEHISDNLKREFHIKHTYSGKRRKRPHRFLK